ncbi:heterokaryon incompatibility protein-domain-containing protein, partial [Halenospora varia]
IDLQVVCNWLQDCAQNHDECWPTRSIGRRAVSYWLWLIDVLNDEVVRPSKSHKYVAFTYVWGNTNKYNARVKDLICSTKGHRCASEGRPVLPLNRSKLPKTVQDAMFLVEAVGERFLWIDSLCIVQDNESELKKTLESMHNVYRQAIFTIVAADGVTADAGLAEAQPDSRDIGPVTSILDGIPTIQSKKKLELATTPWASLGWTFQEAIFSQR